MDTVSMLIKPASGRCNLRCKYCFYTDVMARRTQADMGMMSESLLGLLVRQALELADSRVIFAFQGGEPMLRGLAFYQELIQLEQRYARPGIQIEHSIQTNGTLIDREWAEFFRENRFLVGLSLDGTREYHNSNRVDVKGRGTWTAVESAWRLLGKHHVETNILCVVTQSLAKHGQAAYQSLKKLGCRYLQFIPCLDPMDGRGGWRFSLAPEQYGKFLCTVFDLWYRDWERGDYVSVRLFDDYVRLLAGGSASACGTTGACGQYFVVEGDGSVYPCDFFVLDEWRMGRLGEQTLEELAASPLAARFCGHGRGRPAACEGCRWLPLCGGGCQRDWVDAERNYHCAALRVFFEYAISRLLQMAAAQRRAGGCKC